MKKAACLGITILIVAALIISIAGCAPERVGPTFQPREVKPEPYTPEPEWNPNTDPFLLRIQRLKVGAGVPISAAGIPGAAAPGAPGVPGAPGLAPPAPPPPPRTPLTTDAVYGVVRDRVEGGVIPGAVVKLYNRRGTQIDQFTTNAYGEYSFVDLSPGYYYVVASATGYTATPLSTYNFYYLSGTIVANLELAYSAPYQQIEGGDFLSSTGDVMKVAMYVSAAQIVYNAALFEVRSTEGEVYYTFTVPAPNLNKYSYDNLKVSFPTPYVWDPVAEAWISGGAFQVQYYDWYLGGFSGTNPFGWYQYPDPPDPTYWDTASVTSKNLMFSAIHPTTGQVTIRAKASPDSDPRVLLTYTKMDYDYHKDTSAPVISSPSVAKVGANATISYRVSEDAFVTITLTGPTPSTRSVVNLAGIKSETFAGLANGSYQYTIQATDGAGNASATAGPYSFTIP